MGTLGQLREAVGETSEAVTQEDYVCFNGLEPLLLRRGCEVAISTTTGWSIDEEVQFYFEESVVEYPDPKCNRTHRHACQNEGGNPFTVTTSCTHEGYEKSAQPNEGKPK